MLQHLTARYQAARVQFNTSSQVPRLAIYNPVSVRQLPRVSGNSHLPCRDLAAGNITRGLVQWSEVTTLFLTPWAAGTVLDVVYSL